MYAGRPICGATLINSRYVLTSASCIRFYPPSTLKVRFNATQSNQMGSQVGVASKIEHAGYSVFKWWNREHDIALLRLTSPVEIQNSTMYAPACLPRSSALSSFTNLRTLGFGKNFRWTKTLQSLDLTEVPIDTCIRQYPKYVAQSNICAGGIGQSICRLDFGGPLLENANDVTRVVGVSSFGYCILPKPSIFTRVSSHLDWIYQNTGGMPANSTATNSDVQWCRNDI